MPWSEAFLEPHDLRTAQNPGATRRSASGNRVCVETQDTGEPRLVWMVRLYWPWLREWSKVVGLSVVIGGGNEPVSEQIGDLFGCRATDIKPRGKGMPQPMCAIPANKAAAAVGSIHGRCDRARCQWPSTQSGLPDKQLRG